jgi:hypothetical protein
MLFLAFPLLVTSAFPVPTALPPHSWKTIGDKTFIHGCKAEGLFNASELALASKFPVLTVEKGQGVYLPGYAEDKMAAIAAQWKENRKSMGMPDGWAMFYMNAHFDWTFYRLHAEMLQHPTWAQQQNDHTEGDPCLQNGDPEFPQPAEGMLLFNHSVEDCRNAFIATCVNATTNNGFNGCFIDSAPTEDKLGSSKPAKCKISEIAKRAAGEGGIEMLTELQKSLGSERLIIAKNNFQGGSEEWVNAVMPMDTFCSCYSCTWSTLRSGVTYAQVCQDQILEAIKLGNRGQAPFLHGQVNAVSKSIYYSQYKPPDGYAG